MPLKTLYLTTGCFDKGGISRYSRYQVQALREVLGPENVRVMSLMGPDEYSFEKPMHVDWSGSKYGNVDKIRFAAQAARFCMAWRPGVIHAAHVHFAPLIRWLGKAFDAKTLLNVYGLDIWSGLSAGRRRGLAVMNTVIADCHFSADYVRDFNFRRVRPEVIWDCVDLDRFFPAPCPERVLQKYSIPSKDKAFVILTLGRISSGAMHKGYDRLIQVFAKLTQNYPNSHLVIAGRGDMQKHLAELARQALVADRVHFPGSIDERDLPDVYRSASVFSLVSDRGHGRGEGIPLTPLEASACGVPIIVGNQDGSKEAVFQERNGFVLDPFDLDMHCKTLERLAASNELRQQLADGAVDIARAEWGFDRFREQHRALYQQRTQLPHDRTQLIAQS